MATTNILVVIPARGGSKRVKSKNLLLVGDTPLVTLAVDTVLAADKLLDETNLRVVVSTDDDQIAAVAKMSCEVYRRIVPSTDDETIGDMLGEIVHDMEWEGPVAVIQPTSVPDVVELADMINYWIEKDVNKYLSTATPLRGLYWNKCGKPLYDCDQRINSQNLPPIVYKENGALRLYPAGAHDYNRDPDAIRAMPVVDIDTWSDLQQVRAQHNHGMVVFDVLASEKFGAGHLYRSMSIAEELQNHDIVFSPYRLDAWAIDLLKSRGWDVPTFVLSRLGRDGVKPGVWVNDRLDTTVESVTRRLSDGFKVVNIEDNGPGAHHAHLVVNAMYPASGEHEVGGPDWAVVRPEFFLDEWGYRPNGSNVLVLFGGTDPKDLTFQVADTLAGSDYAQAVVMTGPGYKGAYTGRTFGGSVAEAMMNCDLLVTSGGRTVYEAAAIGLPTVVIAQNLRETTHRHLGPERGNLYFGLADTLPAEKIRDAIEGLLLFAEPRVEMSERSRSMVDGKGVRRIVRRIEDLLEGL